MLFNSIDFLFFFPVVTLLYFVIPKKVRYIWLLIASYYFYMSWNPKYALLIALSTILTYGGGLLLSKFSQNGRIGLGKLVMAVVFVANLGILGIFKYYNFFLDSLAALLGTAGITLSAPHLDLLLPVGISFYTFQALGYMMDVNRGTVKAEKNFFRYALFVSFFPQLVAGPIERSKNLLGQICEIEQIKLWNYSRIRDGFVLMIWGLFQKLVIADRASLLVDGVISNYTCFCWWQIIVAAVFFALQIYCDFGGYTNIARGAAKIMGFELMENFRQPYFAKNIHDFWRRWHISLTGWFTDYLYIPLGGNRKGTLRKYANIAIVFAVSGLWHGARWNFVVWGMLHGCYQIIGDVKNKLLAKLVPETNIFRKIGQPKLVQYVERFCSVLVTFTLVDLAWIFFATPNMQVAIGMLRQLFVWSKITNFVPLGLHSGYFVCMGIGVLLLFAVDFMREVGHSVMQLVNRWVFPARLVIYMALLWLVIVLGIYGTHYDAGAFIYFQF